MRISPLALFVLILLLVPIAQTQDARTPDDICSVVDAPEPETREYDAPEDVLEEGVDYRAIFCTEAGAVYIDLLEEWAPITVNSFVFLAQNDFYNNTTFHRVLEAFMAQGGDPTATGRGGPGYQFEDEFVGFLVFDSPGWLAMANANRPEQGIVGTNGSQFFITTVPRPSLNGRHTIFGEVLEGQENVDNLRLRDPDTATEPGASLTTVVIVTDPEGVETSYTAPEPASEESVIRDLSPLFSQLPPELVSLDEVSFVPEGMLDDYAEFLENNNHGFNVSNTLDNAGCDANIFFVSTAYNIDAFATQQDAINALEDGLLQDLLLDQGFEDQGISDVLNGPYYTRTVASCDDENAQEGVVLLRRGRYIATVNAVIWSDIVNQVSIDIVIGQGVVQSIFEPFLANAYQAELR